MENTVLHKAATRGHADHGWLDSHHTFSFAGYHDPERVHFGVLRVLNDDIVTGGMGFGKHPHDNMEIISIVLDGALEHQDSMGHKQALLTNEVQVMSAGTGVVHSEYNHSKDEKVSFLQIWIFPNKRNVQPRYDQRLFEETGRINQWQTLVAPISTDADSLKINQDAWIVRTKLEQGKKLDYQLKNKNNGVYLFVIDGKVNVSGGQELKKRDGLAITGNSTVNIEAVEGSDVLLLEVPMNVQ